MKDPAVTQHPPQNDDEALLALWDRVGITVRCGYHPFCPCPARMYLEFTCRVALRGLRTEAVAQRRALEVLLQTARDEALPTYWRQVCLEYAQLALTRLADLLRHSDPVALEAIHGAVRQARDLVCAARADGPHAEPL